MLDDLEYIYSTEDEHNFSTEGYRIKKFFRKIKHFAQGKKTGEQIMKLYEAYIKGNRGSEQVKYYNYIRDAIRGSRMCPYCGIEESDIDEQENIEQWIYCANCGKQIKGQAYKT